MEPTALAGSWLRAYREGGQNRWPRGLATRILGVPLADGKNLSFQMRRRSPSKGPRRGLRPKRMRSRPERKRRGRSSGRPSQALRRPSEGGRDAWNTVWVGCWTIRTGLCRGSSTKSLPQGLLDDFMDELGKGRKKGLGFEVGLHQEEEEYRGMWPEAILLPAGLQVQR